MSIRPRILRRKAPAPLAHVVLQMLALPGIRLIGGIARRVLSLAALCIVIKIFGEYHLACLAERLMRLWHFVSPARGNKYNRIHKTCVWPANRGRLASYIGERCQAE